MSIYPATGRVKLRTNLGDHAGTKALKAGEITSDLVEFDFCGPKTPNEGFKPMIREGKFEVGEMAIVTYLLAKSFNKPLVLLPAAMVGRPQHHTICYNTAGGPMKPKDIEGRRVLARSYSVTTAAWVRGILQHEYDVDCDKVTWCTFDDPHVAEYKDPANVERIDLGGKKPDQLVLEGDYIAGILGDLPKDERAAALIPDPLKAAAAWCEKYDAVPVNHFFAVNSDLAKERPDVVREIYRMLKESKARAPKPEGRDMTPFGVEANRKGLELIIQYSQEQKIIPTRYSVEELFDDNTRTFG